MSCSTPLANALTVTRAQDEVELGRGELLYEAPSEHSGAVAVWQHGDFRARPAPPASSPGHELRPPWCSCGARRPVRRSLHSAPLQDVLQSIYGIYAYIWSVYGRAC